MTQQYVPEELVGTDYYQPTDHGAERAVGGTAAPVAAYRPGRRRAAGRTTRGGRQGAAAGEDQP